MSYLLPLYFLSIAIVAFFIPASKFRHIKRNDNEAIFDVVLNPDYFWHDSNILYDNNK